MAHLFQEVSWMRGMPGLTIRARADSLPAHLASAADPKQAEEGCDWISERLRRPACETQSSMWLGNTEGTALSSKRHSLLPRDHCLPC